jgi:dienelactone hydrolase
MMRRRELIRAAGLFGAGLLLPGAGHSTARGANAPRGPSLAHDALEQYEHRFAEARLRMPDRNPALPRDRQAIVRTTEACLGIRDAWIPKIKATVVRQAAFEGGRAEMLRCDSWPGVVGTALLYVPDQPAGKPAPLVVLCCGHGKEGKLTPDYQRMARHIARRGAMVLCPDNLGQGERAPMGHTDCVKPFAGGTSVQGLIVMETLAWIAWARQQSRVDPKRLAAIGNSGGGTLTVFLAALCPDLAVLSASGYPSTFDFIARKEKKHCHCNILPGIVGQLEMWHLLGAFAPRPIFLFQGALDSLIPQDLFYSMARKVRDVYRCVKAEAAFRSAILPGEHPWDAVRTFALGDFLTKSLGLRRAAKPVDENEPLLGHQDRCLAQWPAEALDTDRLAEQLTGRRIDAPLKLWDVFPPAVAPEALDEDVSTRGSTRQIFAQFEAFLKPVVVPAGK